MTIQATRFRRFASRSRSCRRGSGARRLPPTTSGPLAPPPAARSSGKRADLDVPKGYRELLILEPDASVRKLRITDIERRFTVQDDEEVIAIRGDLIAIPLIRFEGEIPRGFRGAHDRTGAVTSGLLSPDLHLV